MRLNGERIALIVITILLVVSVCYIGVVKYKSSRESRDTALLQYGYQSAILQIMQQANGCKEFSVYAQNQTINLIDTSCLKTMVK